MPGDIFTAICRKLYQKVIKEKSRWDNSFLYIWMVEVIWLISQKQDSGGYECEGLWHGRKKKRECMPEYALSF